MKSVSKFLAKHWGFLAATAVTVIAMAEPALANGNTDGFGNAGIHAQTALKSIPNVVSIASYAAGGASVVAGGLKLKAHSDTPNQTPLNAGLMRIAVGGVLMGTPVIGQTVLNTIGGSNTGTTFHDLNVTTQ